MTSNGNADAGATLPPIKMLLQSKEVGLVSVPFEMNHLYA